MGICKPDGAMSCITPSRGDLRHPTWLKHGDVPIQSILLLWPLWSLRVVCCGRGWQSFDRWVPLSKARQVHDASEQLRHHGTQVRDVHK